MTIPLAHIDLLSAGSTTLAESLDRACRRTGLFYIHGHGVDPGLFERLERESRAFFALPLDRKLAIRMERGGRAWRGYFPVGAELTSGKPDRKEGIYFGAELAENHPRVRDGTPLHGANLFPDLPGFRATVLEYMDRMTAVGQVVLRCIAQSLGLEPGTFVDHITRDPLVLFRIFNYPPASVADDQGVGEHTDYGLLTLLWQDAAGLQVKPDAVWIDVPPIPGALICNLGDMLERLSGGVYRSAPHRVRSPLNRGRLAFPFFLDPGFDVELRPLISPVAGANKGPERWDGESVHAFQGTYGEYLLRKVARVFPDLGREVLD